MRSNTAAAFLVGLLLLSGGSPAFAQTAPGTRIVIAATTEKPTTEPKPEARTPEEKMERRFPQPVRVGDLIGLPLLDDDDRTIGRVKAVVRTSEGKIRLIIPYGGFLGWNRRLVAVPIEVVAIAGRQLAALDMARKAFDEAPTWTEAQAAQIDQNEIIRIGLYKR